MGIHHLGKLIIILGIFLVAIGALIVLAPKIPYIGRLPGDIYVKGDRFAIYFPLVSSILISVILTLFLNFIFGKR
jgi:hypothetical protein